MAPSLLSFVAYQFMVSRLPVFLCLFSIESSCDVFMHICSYLTYYIYVFYRENGGGGGGGSDGLSLRFILFLLHGL